MKKNVFSRAIAVLASMTVLGAASMMTASAAGVKGDTVTAEPGSSVNVPFYMADPGFTGADLTFTCDAPLTITDVSGTLAADVFEHEAQGVWAAGTAYSTSKAFTQVSIDVAADAEPGEYPVYVSINSLLDESENEITEGTVVAGTVVIEGEEPADPPATDPPATDPPATVAPTAPTAAATTVATTKAPAAGSPKTGTAGVAVAVAGLVTAGATAVVLKKKH